MSMSMTKGSPLKLMLQFALPLLMGNFLQQTYNIIDAAIVGQILGADALASVGSSSSVQFLVLGFCIGCCAGFGVPVARYFGAGDHRTMRNYIFNGAVLTAIIAAILMIACSLSCGQILHLLSVPDDIFGNAYVYLIVIFIGIPFTLLYNYLSSILRSVGDSRFCIIVLKWGCMGAAIATITAQAISGILCFFYIRGKMQLLRLEKENMIVQKDAVKELLGMGLPMGFQFSITAIGSMVMQAANNGLGSIYVSAFTAAMRIKQFLLCPFDAIGTAASVFCSQNLGARQADRIKKGALEATIAGCIYGFSAGLILIFFGRPLSMIFLSKNATAVLDASAKYLRCLGFFFGILGILNVCRMVTQGLGYSGRAIFSGVMEMIGRVIVSVGFVGTFGYTAICFADQAAWIAASCYIGPTCIWCIRQSIKLLEGKTGTKS